MARTSSALALVTLMVAACFAALLPQGAQGASMSGTLGSSVSVAANT
eukprot:CAMPEP_0197673560 /NCGR_PEP_ID=MMETSP1338-20131121/81217_1 /TAXON_ID=43686 ORGANISM="Pelagodinium beii, Strain RCC1491" /NCGR_SAMPLE_ID=MMETSP1338 /ASSEMBLY_ACC=CAM_ASM_000754 /LENGTH=46 /DNA_ID= /DNA_START= /DNA_END= /DNA_ORIENTATION=